MVQLEEACDKMCQLTEHVEEVYLPLYTHMIHDKTPAPEYVPSRQDGFILPEVG